MIEKNDISFISCHFVRLLLFRKQQNDVFSLSQFSCTAFYFPWKKVGTQKAADAQTPSFTKPSILCFSALTAEILLLVLVIYRVKTKPRNAFSSPMKNSLAFSDERAIPMFMQSCCIRILSICSILQTSARKNPRKLCLNP